MDLPRKRMTQNLSRQATKRIKSQADEAEVDFMARFAEGVQQTSCSKGGMGADLISECSRPGHCVSCYSANERQANSSLFNERYELNVFNHSITTVSDLNSPVVPLVDHGLDDDDDDSGCTQPSLQEMTLRAGSVHEDVGDENIIESIDDYLNEERESTEDCDLAELNLLLKECEDAEAATQPDAQLNIQLAEWTLQNGIAHSHVNKLLQILRNNNHPTLPSTARCLVKTPRNVSMLIKNIASGAFWYNGILKGMGPFLSEDILKGSDFVTLDIFMDGMSPHKSIKRSLWPIIGRIVDTNILFTIAIWCGSHKEPSDVHPYLYDFVQEAKAMMQNFTWDGRNLKLKIRNYIADAPARAFLRNVQCHNSYFSCERCNVRGQWEGRVVYQASLVGELRTDDSFASRAQAVHHKGPSPLEELKTKMISQFPLDGMHLIHLGVMKRIFQMLCSVKKASIHKLSEEKKKDLSRLMIGLAPYCPSEFSRKPRSLTEWKFYKATEFRRILLYDGILLFNEMPKQVKINFMLLHCAIRILSDRDMSMFLDDAHYLLKKFVEHSARPDVYGRTFVVYNVHHLLHFAQDCKLHGCLEDFSAYIYENHMGHFRNYLHAPGRTLSQMVARILEQAQKLPEAKEPLGNKTCVSQPHSSGPLCFTQNAQQYCKVQSNGMIFKLSLNDSCCIMKSNEVVEIKNILQVQGGNITLVGQSYLVKEDFYSYPMQSSCLGIVKVSEMLGQLSEWPIDNVKKKLMRLPLPGKAFLCIPLL